MQVDVGICNLALNHLSVTDRITNVNTEDSPAAVACRDHWKVVLREVLRAHTWRFARARWDLGGPSDSDKPVFGWEYAYKLPEDCLRVIDVYGADERKMDGPGLWEREGNCILTNETAPIYILGMKLEGTADLFDGSFVNALSYRLAAQIAPAVGEKKQRDSLMNTYLALVGHGQSIDSTEASQPEREISGWAAAYTR